MQEMMKFLSALITGKSDYEKTFLFSEDFIKDLQNFEQEQAKEAFTALLKEKGYTIVDIQYKGADDNKKHYVVVKYIAKT